MSLTPSMTGVVPVAQFCTKVAKSPLGPGSMQRTLPTKRIGSKVPWVIPPPAAPTKQRVDDVTLPGTPAEVAVTGIVCRMATENSEVMGFCPAAGSLPEPGWVCAQDRGGCSATRAVATATNNSFFTTL